MTLSRFLRDYLYIPLGGNRHGLTRQLVALLITMALGGGHGVLAAIWSATDRTERDRPIAGAVVFLAPTNQRIAGVLRPYRWLAPAGAFTTVTLLLKLADGPAYEFIYLRSRASALA